MHINVLEQMEQEARTKLRTENPRLFVIFEMAFYLGMRSAEILAARWHWIEKQKGWYQLGVVARSAGTPSAEVQDFAPKSRDRWIPVSEKRVEDWKELCPPKKAWDYIVPGYTPTDRRKAIQREACVWIARFIPDRVKRLHELRKHAGSVIATRDGLLTAAQFLGDSYVTVTTEKHYASLLSPIRPI